MAKLIQYSIHEAKNLICAYDIKGLPGRNIQYFIPNFIMVGLYDDGHIRSGGFRVFSWIDVYEEDIFTFKLYDFVSLEQVEAMVRYVMLDDLEGGERLAKMRVAADLKKSGVEINPDAYKYLFHYKI